MYKIKLKNNIWEYNPKKLLGPPGGFGSVFDGYGKNYGEVAVKKLKVSAEEAGHRELKIVEELTELELKFVIPVLDFGLDEESGSYFIVMDKAEKSLQKEIDTGKTFSEQEAIKILKDIAEGLSEVIHIVHRDLKPGNVLFHNGNWKLADFGIARFVEIATSEGTVKSFLTPDYAAPEQWRSERATNFTDIYALGCIAYTILTGHPPFKGTEDKEEIKYKHLNTQPEVIKEISSKMRSLLAGMLRKEPNMRPDIKRVKDVLEQLSNLSLKKDNGNGAQLLAKAGAIDAENIAKTEAKKKQQRSERDKRLSIANSAFSILREIIDELFKKILNNAPTAIERRYNKIHEIGLGKASLMFQLSTEGNFLPKEAFKNSGWDVVAGATIDVTQERPEYKWSASLWYSERASGTGYRWWEVCYMDSPLLAKRHKFQPFSLNFQDADLAASNRMHTYQLAADPKQIDDEKIEDFCDRWMEIFAKANLGHLSHPRSLPLL